MPPARLRARRNPYAPLLFLAASAALGTRDASAAPPRTGRDPLRATMSVSGQDRDALVYLPADGSVRPAPVLLVFHGHGGAPESAARSFRFHELWPEAVVIYPRGLPTPGALTDPRGEKPGWQSRAGEQGDRDLAFYDALLAAAAGEYGGDPRRTYAAGHSNGGSFVYLLWAFRGGSLAAVAASGAILADRSAALTPKPAFHVAGRGDPLVKFEWQERMMSAVRAVNRAGEGRPWGPWCDYYPSETGAPFAAYVHPGGHEYPTEASEAVIRFFLEAPGP